MLIADTNEFRPLVDGRAYAAGTAPDGSPYSVVILRAHNGYREDYAYASSLAQARLGNLLVGHYGYMVASLDAGQQGRDFAAVVKNRGGLHPGDTIWCDCEEGTGPQSARIAAFLAGAHSVLGDNPADEGEYSGDGFYRAHIGARVAANGTVTHLWIASYGAGPPGDGQDLWQFTDARPMPGVQGACDCSMFAGDTAQFQALFAAPAPPTPSPDPAAPDPPQPHPKERPVIIVHTIDNPDRAYAVYDNHTVSDELDPQTVAGLQAAGIPVAAVTDAGITALAGNFTGTIPAT